MTHAERQSVLNSIDGNLMNLPDTARYRDRHDEDYNFPCPSCDCSVDHRCMNCDDFISRSECNENNGFCDLCVTKNNGDKNEQL